jgi:hypothetical protein
MSSGSWFVVTVAVAACGAVLGVLLTRPVWAARSERPLVPLLLSVHSGVAAIVGIVATAAATRSWQLITEDPPTEHAPVLLEVSRIDGDSSMYALLVLGLAFVTVLSVVALALASRFSAGSDPTERMVACAILGFEVCLSGYAAAQVVGGSRSAVALAATIHLPVAVWAMVACWPPADAEAAARGAAELR